MRRRELLGLGLAALLASCGRTAGPAAGPTFMIFGDPAEKAAFETLVQEFRTLRPDVAIQLSHIPSQGDYRRRIALDFAGGRPADIVLMNYRRYLTFAAKEMLEPLGPRLERSSVLKPSDFFAEALEPFTLGGVLMGIPQNVSSLVVYYNQALFDAAKVPHPAADWTWADFVETAKALTSAKDGRYGLGVEPLLIRAAPFIWQNGGEIAVPHPDSEKRLVFSWASVPQKLALDSAPSREALQWFVDLQTRHRVVPNRVEEESMASEARFMAGRTAMYLESRRAVPLFREIRGFPWDAAPLPRGKQKASILHSDAWFVPASSPYRDQAWAFVEFANSARGQEIMARTGRTVPSLKAVARSAAFLDPKAPPASSQVWLDALPVTRPTPILDTWDEVEGLANQELERAFYGDVPVDEAIRNIQTYGKEYFDRGITR